MRVEIETNQELHRIHLRRYLDALGQEYFSELTDLDHKEIVEDVLTVVSRSWHRSWVDLKVIEETRPLDELAEDERFLISMFVHTFHDGANILRRNALKRLPSLDDQDIFNLEWPAEPIVEACQNAVRDGLVVSIAPEK